MDDRIARIVFEINSTAFDDDCQPAISMMTAQRLIEDHVKIVIKETLEKAVDKALEWYDERHDTNPEDAWENEPRDTLRDSILLINQANP